MKFFFERPWRESRQALYQGGAALEPKWACNQPVLPTTPPKRAWLKKYKVSLSFYCKLIFSRKKQKVDTFVFWRKNVIRKSRVRVSVSVYIMHGIVILVQY
jgi:hypothetical protein